MTTVVHFSFARWCGYADLLSSLTVTCEKYAQCAHRFLSAGPEAGAGVDFRERKLVGVGHSLGGNALYVLLVLDRSTTRLSGFSG